MDKQKTNIDFTITKIENNLFSKFIDVNCIDCQNRFDCIDVDNFENIIDCLQNTIDEKTKKQLTIYVLKLQTILKIIDVDIKTITG